MPRLPAPDVPQPDEIMLVPEVARMLRRSVRSLPSIVSLRPIRIGRSVRYLKSDVQKYLAARQAEAAGK